MDIYSKEFELRHAEKISDDCQDWKVFLTWKNKDPSKASKYVDSIRKIVLRNEGNNANVKMVEGDTQNIICSPVVWQLQYNGLNCADPGDYDALGMSLLTRTFTTSRDKGGTSCGTNETTRLVDVNALRITSGLSQPFSVTGDETTGQVSTFYVNLGSNLLNETYGDVEDVGSDCGGATDELNLTPLGGSWGSQTTFTAVGWDEDGTLVYSNPATSTTGGDVVHLNPSRSGKLFNEVSYLAATGGTYNTSFNMTCNGGTTQTGEDMTIGYYNDAGEIIWTQPGETCDTAGAPGSGQVDVTYDPGDGNEQGIGFGPGAAAVGGTDPTWCNVDYPYLGGTCQVDFDGSDDTNERYIGMREDAGNSPTNYDYIRMVIQQRAQAGAQYQFVDPISGGGHDTTPDKMNYTGVGIGPAPYEGPQTVGFITDRGSKFTSVAQTSAAFKIAKKVCEAVYYVKTSGTSPSEPIQVGPLGEGESTVGLSGGISIKVTQISEDVGTCTAATGSATCTVTGLETVGTSINGLGDPVSGAYYAKVPTGLDTKTSPIIVLDTNADRNTNLVVVGGNTVNTVADEIIRSSSIDLRTETVVMRAIGTNRILVAGYSPQDTATAGDQFIQALIAARGA